MKSRAVTLFGCAVFAAVLLPAVADAQDEVLTNEGILTLAEAGLPAEVIVAKIESTRTAFDTSVEKLVALAQAGVHADVLAAMARAVSSAPAAGEPPERPNPPAAAPEAQPVARTSWQAGAIFSDALGSGGRGPEMVVIPAGRFYMGCVSGMGCRNEERPIRDVGLGQPLAVSKYEVTLDEYDRFTSVTGRPP